MDLNKKIPREVLKVSKTLEDRGFEVFLVGGCVRDLILKKKPKDWDLTTNAKPEEIIDSFKDTFYENNFGTVGVKTNSKNPTLKTIEVTPYRLESQYSDKRHPDKIKFSKKIKDDLARRDFTLNAIAYGISKGQLIDLYKGQEDIRNSIIKTVGNPDKRFGEDALRILRAIRFSAELGFAIESKTLTSIEKNRRLIKKVSRERIKEEFTKIVMSDNPMIGLALCQKMGILKYISPKLEGMVGVEQNKEAHKFDVWEHSLRSLQHAADKKFDLKIRLAALFHDVAKPETKSTIGKKTSYFSHDLVGAYVTRETLKELTFPNEIINEVAKLVRWHMFFSDTEKITLSAVRRLIMNVGKESIWDLINLRKCDRVGTGRPKEEPYRLRKFQAMIEEALRDPISVSMLKISGDDLIKIFRLNPGPHIGHILHALLEDVLEDPIKNDPDYLTKRAEQLLQLSEKDLIEIGKNAKKIKDKAEAEAIENLRKNRFVK